MRGLAIPVVFILVCGCGRSDQGTPPPAAPTSSATQDSDATTTSEVESTQAASDAGKSDVVGRITLNGDIPPPRKLSINKDEEVCGVVGTAQDVSGSDGGVADVVIEIKGVEESDWQWNDPDGGYVIRQKDCQFLPNMLVIPNGKDISVYNDDPVAHNVNTGDWNQMQPSGPDPIVKPVEGKAPIKIGCNIHSWMEGWIYPAQSPFYAVTNQRGEYSIEGIPPGKYRVTIWHAYLGRQTERMTLDAGKVANLDHVYDAK